MEFDHQWRDQWSNRRTEGQPLKQQQPQEPNWWPDWHPNFGQQPKWKPQVSKRRVEIERLLIMFVTQRHGLYLFQRCHHSNAVLDAEIFVFWVLLFTKHVVETTALQYLWWQPNFNFVLQFGHQKYFVAKALGRLFGHGKCVVQCTSIPLSKTDFYGE